MTMRDEQDDSTEPPDPSARLGRVAVALFAERDDVERAIRDLHDNGFGDRIGVAMRDPGGQKDLAPATGTQAAEGAAAGAVGGGVIGGLVGLLIGAGALVIPGIGPVIAGGAMAAAFGVAGGTAVAGAGIGAAGGGIVGGLVGMGIPHEDARYFEQGFNAGGILVTVDARARPADAVAILERNGADMGPRPPATDADSSGPGSRRAGA